MNQIWLQIFIVMIGSSIVKTVFENLLVWICIDIAVLAICYMILRRHPYVNLKSSMLFLSGLTVISILTDARIISGFVGNIIILAVLAWMVFGPKGNGNSAKRQNPIRHKWHK